MHFPRSCLHCEEPACVTVCPTGASYKRAEDGIVLVNAEICIGCKLCSWACPYGAREFDEIDGIMKKCTLCIDRIYNDNLDEPDRIPACVQVCPVHARHFGDLGDPDSAISGLVRERGGVDLMPELGYRPVNKYLPPRQPVRLDPAPVLPVEAADEPATGFWRLVDRLLGGAGSSTAKSPPVRMNPAYSIILFSTASGTGYGMLAAAGMLATVGFLPADRLLAWATLAPALALITAGLLASSAHLGRPERAWRAFSQWRTSWLSREGVAAVATYLIAAPFILIWAFVGAPPALTGIATLLMVAVTVFCTAMIYASLKPIPDWHDPWTVPVYLSLAAMTGWLWLAAIALLTGNALPAARIVAVLLVALAWACKEAYWRHVAARAPIATVATATGLADRGRVRLFEAPHTETNYLLREMGHKVARRHRRRLRAITRASAFALPLALSLLGGPVAAGLAALSAALGVVVERWLFFAEARHTVTLYYGAAEV